MRKLGAAMLVAFAASCFAGSFVRADQEQDETNALFKSALEAFQSGRPGDAIAGFEALADRGVVDPQVSFDRGLAYADRVRISAEIPGDLGRAAQGFEEAGELSKDPVLAAEAVRALAVVRAEVARRRAQAGQPAEVDPGISLGRSIVGLAPENAWAFGGLAASLALGIALLLRGFAGDAPSRRRRRVGASTAVAIAAPMLAACTLLALAARSDRLHRREGVIVSTSARPADQTHLTISGASPLPEAARVEIVENGAADAERGWTHVRWAAIDGWIPSASVRLIARPE